MARRIAKFHKVSFEQFREGFMDSFGPIEEEKIKEAYDGVNCPKEPLQALRDMIFIHRYPSCCIRERR